jgi:hypothetical protein
MTQVHYFQRYSQRENVDTNNTLLLLSRIQVEDPRLLRDVLSALFSDSNLVLEIGAQFLQQTASPGGSIPDGTIYQTSFRLVIETKRSPHFSTEQLADHLSVFGTESVKLLILLTPERCAVTLPTAQERGVQVVSRSFSDIVAACRAAGLYDHIDLREIVEDYEQYCDESRLLSSEFDQMLVVPVSATLEDNLQLRLYYAPAERGYRKHRFLGLYTRKSVQAIGELENVVSVDVVGGTVIVRSNAKPVTPEQEHRVQQATAMAPKHGYDISSGHTFFLVREFIESDFRKTSPGGLFGKRYFNLREELGLPRGSELPSLLDVSKALRECSWE